MTNLSFIKTVSKALNLSKTDIEIIKTLISEKSGLLISDLIQSIRRSERNVRNRLNDLLEKGIIVREIEILKNKRLAYRYKIESNRKLIDQAKNHLLDRVRELNKLKCMY